MYKYNIIGYYWKNNEKAKKVEINLYANDASQAIKKASEMVKRETYDIVKCEEILNEQN